MDEYDKAPIRLDLQADWGTLTTFVSTFQLKRPIIFDNDVVALRAQRRHFRLPLELKQVTKITLAQQQSGKELMTFYHQMKTEGDVPEMELDAIVRITNPINEQEVEPGQQVVIKGVLLRGFLSIQLDKHSLSDAFWPHRKQPQRLILDSHSCWVEMDESKLKLRPVPIVEPADGRQEGIQWEILDVSNYQSNLISSIRTIGHLPETQGMTSPAHDGLQLSVAPYGPVQGVLRVNTESFQYVLQNAVIFTGLRGTTWVPNWTIISFDDGGQMSHFSFTDIPSDEERTEAPLPCLSWPHKDDQDDSFTLSLHSSDERTLALVGSQDPEQLQGAYLWSYQELKSNWGWLRWPICKSEHVPLVPKEDPFEVGVSGSTPLQWHWRLGLDRAHNASSQDNGIELRLDSNGLWTFCANKLHFSMASPEIRLYSGNTPLVDPDCPPALTDPKDDLDLVKSRLQFVLASKTSPDGLSIPFDEINGESKTKTVIFGRLDKDVKLAGSVDWIGSPDPKHAWIFTESVTGRNLPGGATTAWDPHAGKCWATIDKCVLKSIDNQLMILEGALQPPTNFQATLALLPWVEGSKADENIDRNTKLEVFHRNLICEIEEARAARADRGLRPDQRDQLSHADRTRAVRDRYASLGWIDQTLRRDHFWPGLKLNGLNLTQPLSLQPGSALPTALPTVQIGGRTMQLRTEPSNPPTAIPNHSPDWLDYQVYLRSLVNDEKQPNPEADVVNDGDQDLHRGLLMKDGFWLDQSGALCDPTPDILAGFHMQVVHQAALESDSESFSWRRYALLTGCISLAVDATVGHSIKLFLDSFLIDLKTNKPPEKITGALQVGAWKLLGRSSEESPRFFGLPLSEVSIEKISNETVTLKVLLLAPSEATTTSAVELEFPVNPAGPISLKSSKVSYQFHSLDALPFPHGGLPAQLTCLTGELSLQANSNGNQELHLTPSEETSLGLSLGVSWPCIVPVLKAHGGGWSNQSQPSTRTPFWMESFQDLGNQPKFSCHSLHLEHRTTAGFEEEDFSQAGFLIWTTTQLRFHSLYEPENPLRFEIEDLSSSLVDVDLLISRRAFAMSSSLQPEGARQIFLIRDQQNIIRVWPKSAQPTPTTDTIPHQLDEVRGSLLLPISNSQQHGLAIAVWTQNTLRILWFSSDGPEPKQKDLGFETIRTVLRIPNQENQLIVIDAQAIHLAKLQLDAADASISKQLLDGLAFKSIHQIIGIDCSAFLVVDDTRTAFVITPGNDSWNVTKIPNSQNAILVPELDIKNDTVERSDPRLFLAKVQDNFSVVHHWSLPKPSVTAADVEPEPFATIKSSVSGGLSTPLGPWWFAWEVQPTQAKLRVFSLDDWVEWDEKGLRADVQMKVRTAHDPQDEHGKVPFDLVCRISRGHTLAMTHKCGESFSPAWPRQAQGQYTAFAVPSHTPQLHWTRGFLVLWPELLHDTIGESIVMAGAWFRESWQTKFLTMTATETFPEQNWPCRVEGTLHILEVDWWQSNEWKHDITITGSLQSSGSNWSLQIHEQAWQADTPILGLLFLQQGAGVDVQLPMSLIPKGLLQIDGEWPSLEIQPGLYSVNEVASLLGSVELTDMSLPKPAGEGEDSYDIQPVTLATENQWCRLTPGPQNSLILMAVNPDDQLPFLDLEARSELPKQPVARPQLTHRRVFGARLRFGSNVVPFQPMITNAWNVIGNVYNCNANGNSENPDNLTAISRFMINNEAHYLEFTPQNRNQLWNAQARAFNKDEENPNWDSIKPGDHFTAWTPAQDDVSGIKPVPKPVEFKRSTKYIGALTAQAAGNLWMFQEPYWVSLSTNGPDKVYRTENVLVVGRSENTADPAVRCLRSVTDVVGSSTDRGLDPNTLWSFLLESGASGLVVQRLFQAAGPPVYRFSRSPFSIPAGDISIVPQSPQVAESNNTGALLPIVLQGQPRSTQTFLAQYVPSFETSCPALPIFSRDYRHVSVQLKSNELNSSGTTTCSSLLLQESVCYADQALNDPSEHTASSPLPPTSTFYPLALDLVYATDKPGAMLSHSLDLHQMRGDQMAHGLRTMFAMRDPRQVILPPGAQLRISQPPLVKANSITLGFEEVLGSLPAPSKPVETLIAPDPTKPDSFILDYEALLLFTVIGDELIQLKQDSPYLPLESSIKSPCIYLVSKGQLSKPCVVHDGQNMREFELDAIQLEDETRIGTTDYWRATIKKQDQEDLQLSWKEKTSGENPDPSLVTFFAKPRQVRLIPALATPKLGIVTCKEQEQNLDLFASAKGGNAVFNLINDSHRPVVEVSNQYCVSWHSQTAGFDTLHVVKYFSDGQTLCTSWPVPPV
ncbi:hypothetical protein NZK33_13265 [Cyanobium sp. FGCU-6]|nr:hypothetical protein [Cyanobium sp. FGCU6]